MDIPVGPRILKVAQIFKSKYLDSERDDFLKSEDLDYKHPGKNSKKLSLDFKKSRWKFP